MDIKKLSENLGLEQEEYAELLELFIESGIADIEKLKNAIEVGDAEESSNIVHSLKGAAGNLGLSDYYEAAKEIELDIKNGNLDKVVGSAEQLREKIVKISGII